MKKIFTFILLACMILTFAACADNGSATPANTTPESTTTENTTPENNTTEITLQEVYDAGKNLAALLGDHENVYVQATINGKVIREEYLSKQYCYSFSSAEYMDMGFEYADFTTDRSEYVCLDNTYELSVTLTPGGAVDAKERFAAVATADFISSAMLNNYTASIAEKDGSIIITHTFSAEEISAMGNDVVSCVETYTLDAKKREMTSIKTVYTYKDGTVEEGIVTITRDVEAPEGVKPFLAYEQETENLRTVTFVSNPNTENENTESVRVTKGLKVGFYPDWDVEKDFTMYADAACTQAIEGELDVNSDVTIYIKWDE
jgi:hypothetical protein